MSSGSGSGSGGGAAAQGIPLYHQHYHSLVLLASVLPKMVWVLLADESGDFRLGAVRGEACRIGR